MRTKRLRAIARLIVALAILAAPHDALAQTTGPTGGKKKAPRAPEAKLMVAAAEGAALWLDGRRVAITPLAAPLKVAPGKHFVAVLLDGFEPHAQTVTLLRGKTTTLSVDLAITDQRAASWALLSTGWAALGAGIGLGIAAVVKHRAGRDALQQGDDEAPEEAITEAQDAFSARDDFRIGSGIAGGAGLALLLVGGGLFVLDSPSLPARDTALAALPWLAPDRIGATMSVRF